MTATEGKPNTEGKPKRERIDPRTLPALDMLQRYSVEEALAYLRTSRDTFYKHVACGAIRVQKRGRRTYITGAEIARVSRAEEAA